MRAAAAALGLLAAIGARGACVPPADPAAMHDAQAAHLPTPHAVVEAMLDLAAVSPRDVVYDLGSGDGRIVIAAARRGARAVGVELDGRLIEFARCLAREAGVEERVEFRREDFFRTDLRGATVVTLFLFPEVQRRLAPKLFAELPRGARIVSHRFDLGGPPPERTIGARGSPLVLLWVVR